MAITNLTELVSDDKVEVVVSGNVVNRGSRPTTTVLVQVSGLDRDGRSVLDVQVTPSSQRINDGGGSAAFSAVLPNNPAVVDYHVEARGYAIGVPPAP